VGGAEEAQPRHGRDQRPRTAPPPRSFALGPQQLLQLLTTAAPVRVHGRPPAILVLPFLPAGWLPISIPSVAVRCWDPSPNAKLSRLLPTLMTAVPRPSSSMT
jgi:hypothetical protein